MLLYDFNGDGLPDAAYLSNGSSGVLYVALNTGSGFGSPINTGINVGTSDPPPMYGDLLGTGTDGILANNGGTFYYYTYNASSNSFSGVSTGVAVQSRYQYVLTDITGDGLPDLVGLFGLTTQMVTIQNTSSGGAVSFGAAYYFNGSFTTGNKYQYLSAQSGHPSPNRDVDFNGDGRKDVFLETITWTSIGGGEYDYKTYYYQLISQGANAAFQVVQVHFDTTPGGNPVFGNFNDDNCTDVAVDNQAYYSACNGTIASIVTLSGTDPVLAAIDWDGDGRTDLIAGVGGSTLNWYHATGTGFASEASTGYTLPSGCSTSVNAADVNGDGLEDLQCASSYYLHNGVGQPPDLLTSATDGFGMQMSFTYAPLPSGTAYSADVDSTHGGPDPTYPHSGGATLDPPYAGPIYVTSQLSASDGTGGTYTDTFWYYGARMNYAGRGFDGFYAKRTLDSRNGIYTYEYFRRDFPYTGMLWGTLEDQPNNSTTMDSMTNTPLSESLDSTHYNTRQFAYVSSSAENTYETQGSENGDWITQKTTTYGTPDIYGNFPTITLATVDKDPGSPFLGNTFTHVVSQHFSYGSPSIDWCIHIPDTVTVQNTLPDGTTTATRHYGNQGSGVDYANCRVTDAYIEAGTTLAVTTHYDFDPCGNRQAITVTGTKPDGTQMGARKTTYNFGTSCQLPESITNALNQTTNIVYNYNFGVPTQFTDPNGIVTKWTQDAFGRLQTETRPDNTTSTYTYYNCYVVQCGGTSDLRLSVFRDDVGTDNKTNIGSEGRYWDGLNRLRYVQKTHPFGTIVNEQINVYDALGNMIDRYQPVSSGSNGYTVFSYELLRNRVKLAQLYNSNGTLDRTTSWAYAGRTTTITDPRGYNTIHVADVLGRLRQITDPSPGGTSYFAFDPFGNLSNVTDPINAGSSATYNVRGFMTKRVDADLGTWTYNGDSLNELVSWTDANNKSFGVAYDALGRMTSRTEPEGTSSWQWDNCTPTPCIGRLQSASGYGYSEARAYDSILRLQTRTITTDQPYQYDYAYNSLNGAIDTITYPAGPSSTRFKIQYAYSYLYPTQITDVTNPNSPVTLWTLSAVNDYYSATSETFGSGSAALSVSRGYKAWTDELTSVQSGVSGSTTNRQNLAYQWDVNDNLTQRQDLNQSLTEVFTPDPLNRVQSSTLNGTQNLSVSYDAAGDITSRSDVGSYTYGDSHHAHGVTAAGGYSFVYDANGNVVTRNGLTLTWASYNLPIALQATVGAGTYSSQFQYGPDHQRYQQSATYSNGTEVTNYAGGLFEKVGGSDLQGITWYRNYVPTPSGLTIIVANSSNSTTTTTYALSDHLASSDALVDGATGNLLVQESFGAFGLRRGSNWSGSPSGADYAAIAQATRRGFTFHEELDNIALVHMNGRVYDPNVGRFLSADPMGVNLSTSQSWNRYSYVANGPLSFVDPTGFDGCTVEQNCKQDAGGGSMPEVVVTAPAEGDFSGPITSGVATAPQASEPNLPTVVVTGHKPTPRLPTIIVTATPLPLDIAPLAPSPYTPQQAAVLILRFGNLVSTDPQEKMPERPPLPTVPPVRTEMPYTPPPTPVYDPMTGELTIPGEPVQLELPFLE